MHNSKSNINPNEPSNKTNFFPETFPPGRKNNRGRTYFSKSRLLYPLPPTGRCRGITSRSSPENAAARAPCFGTINVNGSRERCGALSRFVRSFIRLYRNTTVPRELVFGAARVQAALRPIGGRRATIPPREPSRTPARVTAYRKCSSDDKSAVDPTVLRRLQRSRVLLTRRHPVTCGMRYGDTTKPHISLFANPQHPICAARPKKIAAVSQNLPVRGKSVPINKRPTFASPPPSPQLIRG